jgi:uncharacterized protein (UPF0248 family)
MMPIQSLLHRIRWDSAFGGAGFTVGYHDRSRHVIVTVPIERIHVEPGHRFSFTAIEADGSAHEVPFHRVRVVRRDGETIWQRRVDDRAVGHRRGGRRHGDAHSEADRPCLPELP